MLIWHKNFLSILLAVFFIDKSFAVKNSDFKRCDQSGFCVRNRAFADLVDLGQPPSVFRVDRSSLKWLVDRGEVLAELRNLNSDVNEFLYV
jgi:hypothetical protein